MRYLTLAISASIGMLITLAVLPTSSSRNRTLAGNEKDNFMAQRPVPDVLYGVTLENVEGLSQNKRAAIVDSLEHFHSRPAVRIVFDFARTPNASNYKVLASEVWPKASAVLGEILDSAGVNQCDLACYGERTTAYLDSLDDHVDIWEVGNEVNGNWLRPHKNSSNADVIDQESKDVAEKIYAATKLVKDRKGRTALTVYYNEDCWKFPQDEMFSWTEAYLLKYLEKQHPDFKLNNNLNYVLISYYEDDCNDLQPDWPKVFGRLAELFPNSKIGFGECGSKKKPLKQEQYLRRYYVEHQQTLRQIFPEKYVGGYFWWYFKRDMVPRIKNGKINPLWGSFDGVIQ